MDPDLKIGRTPARSTLAEAIAEVRQRDPAAAPRRLSLQIDKSERKLRVLLGDRIVREYGNSLGFSPEGDKERQGDGKTPEGEFYIVYKAPPVGTRFYRGLLLSYPSPRHADLAFAKNLITAAQHKQIQRAHKSCAQPPQGTGLGGYVLIHGSGGGPGYGDWTLGCVALTNTDINEIHAVVEAGCGKDGAPRTPIVIEP